MSTSTTSTKKCVRFVDDNDARNTVQVFEPHPSDASLWFTDEECANSKRAQRITTLKLRQNGVDRLVENSFAHTGSDVQKTLNEFTRHTEGRGLERQVCQIHYQQRMQHRALAIKAIILGQQQAQKQGLKLEDVSEQLRELSLQYCCAAKIFARRMGKADEYACYKKSKSNSTDSVTSADTSSKKSKKSSSSASKKSKKSSTCKLALVTSTSQSFPTANSNRQHPRETWPSKSKHCLLRPVLPPHL